MSRTAAIEPRVLSREAAATYCGCDTVRAFDEWVRKGIVPRPIPGTTKWDRCAIDRALDRYLPHEPSMSLSPFDRWKAEQDADAT